VSDRIVNRFNISGSEAVEIRRGFINFKIKLQIKGIRGSVVGIGTGYWLHNRRVGVRVPVGSIIFSSHRPDRFRGPPNLLSN
jgi:hypothetical protein